MTVKELSRYYEYTVLIASLTEEIEHLEYCSMGLTASYGGNGGGSGSSGKDVVSIQASQIIAKKEALLSLKLYMEQEREKIVEYIFYEVAPKDALVAGMMYQRFVKLKSWHRVAMAVGGNNTADSCRMAVFRYCGR